MTSHAINPLNDSGFLWSEADGTRTQGQISGQYFTAVNAHGLVAGWECVSMNLSCGLIGPLWWTPGTARTSYGVANFQPHDMNDAGVTVGSGVSAYVWTRQGGLVTLPTLGKGSARATPEHINNGNVIVGASEIDPGRPHAVVWWPRDDLAAAFPATQSLTLRLGAAPWTTLHPIAPRAMGHGDLDGDDPGFGH